LQPGDIVGGRYRVIQAVAEGPLDRLYEAQDVHLHERAIVRIMRRSQAHDAQRVREFEQQVRAIGGSAADPSIRVLELSRDSELGPFAAISNKESRPLSELLALLTGVDGTAAAPPPTPRPVEEFRFPSSHSQVELEALKPPAAAAARDQASPQFAKPRRPKKLETLELDVPRFGTTTGPRPALKVHRSWDWGLLRKVGLLALIITGLVVGAYLYLERSERDRRGEDGADEGAKDRVIAPHREVQIVFRVTPARARLRIDGQLAPGHSILVPESDKPFAVRFEARGFKPRAIEVVPNRNRTVLVVLNPKHPGGSAP